MAPERGVVTNARFRAVLVSSLPVVLRAALTLCVSLLAVPAAVGSQPSPRGTCADVTPLLDGTTVRGSTVGLPDRAHASCARQALSGERVYSLHLDQPAHVSLRVAADYDVAVYVRGDCADEVSELACNDDREDARHAGLDLDLAAGTWFVFVDGYDSDSTGSFTLTVNARPTAPRASRTPSGPPTAGRAPSRPRS